MVGARLGPLTAKVIAVIMMKNENFCKYNLAENNLGDEGAKEIGRALSAENKSIIGETDVNSGSSGIISLNLSSNAITSVGMNALLDSLSTNETLIELNISSKAREAKNKNKINQQALQKLQNLLLHNRYLNILDISGNAIKEEGLRLLAEAYEKNAKDRKNELQRGTENEISISSLNLSQNEICTIPAFGDLGLIL